MIKIVTDPALTDTPTLVVYAWQHELYLWWKDRRPRYLYYRNGDYRSGRLDSWLSGHVEPRNGHHSSR